MPRVVIWIALENCQVGSAPPPTRCRQDPSDLEIDPPQELKSLQPARPSLPALREPSPLEVGLRLSSANGAVVALAKVGRAEEQMSTRMVSTLVNAARLLTRLS